MGVAVLVTGYRENHSITICTDKNTVKCMYFLRNRISYHDRIYTVFMLHFPLTSETCSALRILNTHSHNPIRTTLTNCHQSDSRFISVTSSNGKSESIQYFS